MKLLVRPPTDAFRRALSSRPERDRIDPSRALVQHQRFVRELQRAGLEVITLAPEPAFPDAPFVSDTMVALSRPDRGQEASLVVVTRPGAPSRRGEVDSVASCLRRLAPSASIEAIVAPGTLDGGDVIVYGNHLAVGVSARTNREGADQLAELARRLGYRVHLCPVADRLHLASAVSVLGPRRLIGTRAGFRSLEQVGALGADVDRLLVPDTELPAANVLAAGGRCFVAAGYPTAVRSMEAAGEVVVPVELDEFLHADGGPTCLVGILP
jgi:dimethylargininase